MAPKTAKAKKPVEENVEDSESIKKTLKTKNLKKSTKKNHPTEVEDVSGDHDDVEIDKTDDADDFKSTVSKISKPKKTRSKQAEKSSIKKKVDVKSAEEDPEENLDPLNVNGQTDEIEKVSNKQAATPKKESKKTLRNKENVKELVDEEEVIEEQPNDADIKPTKKRPARSGNKIVKQDVDVEEDEKAPAKGKKKTQTKASKEEVERNEVDDPKEIIDKEKPAKSSRNKKQTSKEKKQEVVVTPEISETQPEDEPVLKKRKATKKNEKNKDVNDQVEEIATKPTKEKKASSKKTKEVPADADAETESQETGEPTSKRQRKATELKGTAKETKQKEPLKNKSTTNYDAIDFSNSSKSAEGKRWNLKISSWNVDGIRAWLNKGGLDYINNEKPNILCLQEVKCSQDKLPHEVVNIPGYHAYWLCSDKDGYAGVAIYTTKLAMNVQYGLQNKELDDEGRIITAEYEQFYLICTYVPNAGRKLVTLPKRLRWNEAFRAFVKDLDKKKPVIICGDMNVAHNEIDLANPKTNKKSAGFTIEERTGMTDLLSDGFIDTFRHLYPDKTGAYTFWTYMSNSRAKNVGWRLDYFIVSERLVKSTCDNVIRNEVYGSDHCPIALFMYLSTAASPKE